MGNQLDHLGESPEYHPYGLARHPAKDHETPSHLALRSSLPNDSRVPVSLPDPLPDRPGESKPDPLDKPCQDLVPVPKKVYPIGLTPLDILSPWGITRTCTRTPCRSLDP